jgi:aminopeptidase
MNLIQAATDNLKDILLYSLKYQTNQKALIIYDTDYELTNILTQGYRQAFKEILQDKGDNNNNNDNSNITFYNFADIIDGGGREYALSLFNTLNPDDLVILIQSSSFRLDDFRIRLHLFSNKLKVIEHMHLHRNDSSVFDVYIDSLKYDLETRNWYNKSTDFLNDKLTKSQELIIESSKLENNHNNKCQLIIKSSSGKQVVEQPKFNIGNYSNMINIGGTFPIGELFTEACDFSQMNGSAYIYAFADKNFNISFHKPFRIDIKAGLIAGYGENTPQEFIEILNTVSTQERLLIREIGFGLNKAISKERFLGDITAFERIQGIHLSLGEKHSVYKKEGITTHKTKFHIDLFVQTLQVISKEKDQETIQEIVIYPPIS